MNINNKLHVNTFDSMFGTTTWVIIAVVVILLQLFWK
jgi:hypothetical protein